MDRPHHNLSAKIKAPLTASQREDSSGEADILTEAIYWDESGLSQTKSYNNSAPLIVPRILPCDGPKHPAGSLYYNTARPERSNQAHDGLRTWHREHARRLGADLKQKSQHCPPAAHASTDDCIMSTPDSKSVVGARKRPTCVVSHTARGRTDSRATTAPNAINVLSPTVERLEHVSLTGSQTTHVSARIVVTAPKSPQRAQRKNGAREARVD